MIDFFQQLRIQHLILIIYPHLPLLIIPAVKPPARHCSVLAHYEFVSIMVKMNAIPILAMRYEIRTPEFPADNPLLHILF